MPDPSLKSIPLPPHRGVLAVDAVAFTRLPASRHAPTNVLIHHVMGRALSASGLGELWQTRRFPADTGDGVAFGFDPRLLPFVLWPFLDTLEEVLALHNVTSSGPPIRLRAAVHIGPLPDSGLPGDGNGTARNDTHRLLDSEPLRQALACTSADSTNLAAIISQRVYEDVVLGGYTGLSRHRCVKVDATVANKGFSQPAWLYVPRLSGSLLQTGLTPSAAPRTEFRDPKNPPPRPAQSIQHVGSGVAFVGEVSGDFRYTGEPRR
ncbi:hypothetical protein [Streptomyces sp. NBC_00091]|uniref:hypothetical protein n=1 Tax=Streptomyces sp. NBC_00091 TaxID=2975648 RepID=UPI00225848FB|nr:hypothetical protein [Streptomyces sp. NBC_00091]MCX5376780.1 hypothetical protein [Streptomyces sp. NBC_00091]